MVIKNKDSNSEKYLSLQYALYLTPFVLIFGGIAFLYNSTFIVADHELCKAQIQGITEGLEVLVFSCFQSNIT